MEGKFLVPIVISGLGGCGKSVSAKLVAEKLGMEVRSGGGYIRALAKEHGKNVDNGEFQKYREDHPEIDIKLDQMQFHDLCKGNMVLESRFGALYHPHRSSILLHGFHEKIGVKRKDVLLPGKVFTIFLSCDDHVRYQRLYTRASRDPRTSGITFDQIIENEKRRHQSDLDLYKKLYNLNPFDPFYSEYMIGVEDKSPEENANTIINKYKYHLQINGL